MGVYLDIHHDPDEIVACSTHVIVQMFGQKGDGPLTIGHDCATVGELDSLLKQLESDIAEIRAKAPEHFAQAMAARMKRHERKG